MKRGLSAAGILVGVVFACHGPDKASFATVGADAGDNAMVTLEPSISRSAVPSVPVPWVGKLVNDRRLGVWKYYWPDGSLALIGEFDDRGYVNGPWVYLTPTHTIELDVRVGLYCDGNRLGWRDLAFEEWSKAWGDDPLTWLWYRWPELTDWSGPGLYSNGSCIRELQPAEACTAVTSLQAR